jgi:hypothetical protein
MTVDDRGAKTWLPYLVDDARAVLACRKRSLFQALHDLVVNFRTDRLHVGMLHHPSLLVHGTYTESIQHGAQGQHLTHTASGSRTQLQCIVRGSAHAELLVYLLVLFVIVGFLLLVIAVVRRGGVVRLLLLLLTVTRKTKMCWLRCTPIFVAVVDDNIGVTRIGSRKRATRSIRTVAFLCSWSRIGSAIAPVSSLSASTPPLRSSSSMRRCAMGPECVQSASDSPGLRSSPFTASPFW